MATHQLVLDTLEEELSLLVAIHCAIPSFKLAYNLNKYLQLRLKREDQDVLFSYTNTQAVYPYFRYEDQFNYTTYSLVKNTCNINELLAPESQSLFQEDTTVTKFLIPECSNVDYFLKINFEVDQFPIKSVIETIKNIPQVVTTYEISQQTLKSKNNLIFE